MSYAQYYLRAYGIKIKDMKQPLIHTISRTEKKMNKNGEIK
jgi:hypothetical protein